MSFNKITCVGNIGKDPVLRYTPQGMAVCDFSVATSSGKRDEEKTMWFRVTAWGSTAEFCAKYLTKGKLVYVDGTLSVEEWHDKERGPQFSLKVNANTVQALGAKNETALADEETSKSEAVAAKPGEDTDIPF